MRSWSVFLSCAVGCVRGPGPEIAPQPPSPPAPIEVLAGDDDSADEIAAVHAHAAQALEALSRLLGPGRVPPTLTIRLLGEAEIGEVPRVDPETGEVWLVKFPGQQGGYTASLSHEIVHACRRHLWTDEARQTSPYLYLEEGLAELAAIEISAPSAGFPLYGTPAVIAAGQWLVRDEALPIEALVRHHVPLNLHCMAQSYTTRIAFLGYLRERHGLDPLIALAYQDAPVTVDELERAYGAPLSELARAWEAYTIAAYHETPQADAIAARFRDDTPIRYLPVCGPEALAGLDDAGG